MTEYENSYLFRNKGEVEKYDGAIKRDGDYFRNMYDTYSKALNGEATKSEIDSLSDFSYIANFNENEMPKKNWGLKIRNALRRFIGKPGYLMTSEQSIYEHRRLCLSGIYEHATKYIDENNIKPRKEKTEFDKLIEVDLEQSMTSQKERDKGAIGKRLESQLKDDDVEYDD